MKHGIDIIHMKATYPSVDRSDVDVGIGFLIGVRYEVAKANTS